MDKIKNNKICFSDDEKLFAYVDEQTCSSVLPIDQSYGLPSNINAATGFPYSDIQLVMRANSLAERNRLMDNLQVAQSDFIDEQVTNEQACTDMSDSRAQMPSECIEQQQERLHSAIEEHNSSVEEAARGALYDKFVNGSTSEPEPKTD